MIPVMQTIFRGKEGEEKGDCLRACICSLLHLKIEEVPNFVEYEPSNEWLDGLEKWLKQRGYRLVFDCHEPTVEYYMVWGMSVRKTYHSAIYSKGELVHDPHPNGGGVDVKVYAWLEKL
jgi:hypothetical protein